MSKSIEFSNRQTVFSILSIFILVFSQIVSSVFIEFLIKLNSAFNLNIPGFIFNIVLSILYVLILFLLIKLIYKKALKFNLSDFKINKFLIKPFWIISAFLMPILVCGIMFLFPGNLHINSFSTEENLLIITASVFFYGLATGIAEETIFRGIIMSAVEKRFNKKIAILVPSMLFGLLHIVGRNLNFASIIQLFIAGTAVGILFSLITYETNSIWSGAFVHGIWNIFMVGSIINFSPLYSTDSIFNYILNTKSILITGGDFGVESSIFAIIVYIIFSYIAIIRIKNKKVEII